ncbi:hypothetical protein PLEOSDRAFT_1044449 [Pleurotus ostreatus PC15]|uniref:Uncharacterized protein n=1 Tax=Pleurotus ostreatus (strain PC15) TaxID=1137138 RepID=A0A067NPE2_PLEO1|nr:hypothetical protein PLEOSDRAFT_1044449 [Pleurotus ostreatus PC15]
MPSLTTTIDDPSPLISYSDNGNWFQPTAEIDSTGISIAGHSFTVTSTTGANMTFSFNGTGVQIFGSRKEERGNYDVAINGTAYTSVNSPVNYQYRQSLFALSKLPQALHTITLTHQPLDKSQVWLDIDSITWISEIGTEGDQLIFTTYQDTDPSFVYNPPSAWSTLPDQLGTFNGGSGQSVTLILLHYITHLTLQCNKRPLKRWVHLYI